MELRSGILDRVRQSCPGYIVNNRIKFAGLIQRIKFLGVKIFAWGIGGIVFGVVADRIGRAKTMIVTVLIYSVFTGLSGLAQGSVRDRAIEVGRVKRHYR